MAYMIQTVVTRPDTETKWFGAADGNEGKGKLAVAAVRNQIDVISYFQKRINQTNIQRTLIATTQAAAEAALVEAAKTAGFAEREAYESANGITKVTTTSEI